MLKLHDGSSESFPTVATTMETMRWIFETDLILGFEAVQIAKDKNHQPFGNAGERLAELALLDHTGRMHDSVRTIINNAATGDGASTGIRWPAPREPA